MKTYDNVRHVLKDFQALSEEMEGLMQDFFGEGRPIAAYPGHGFLPSIDCFETDKEIVCLIELAGVAPQDLEINLDGLKLAISGVRNEIPGFDRRRYHKMELDFGFFERSVTLPESVEADSLRIENLGGIYLIRLKKTHPGLEPKEVDMDMTDPDPRR